MYVNYKYRSKSRTTASDLYDAELLTEQEFYLVSNDSENASIIKSFKTKISALWNDLKVVVGGCN
jgi:hypothetical protein